MRNLLALVGAIVVTVGGLGWYLDWFKIRNNPAPAGYRSLNIDINTGKISEDIHRGTARVQEALEKRSETEAKAKPTAVLKGSVDTKVTPPKAVPPEVKKPFLEEGEEAEEPPVDLRRPQ
jgi:hypothetical protein